MVGVNVHMYTHQKGDGDAFLLYLNIVSLFADERQCHFLDPLCAPLSDIYCLFNHYLWVFVGCVPLIIKENKSLIAEND